jgi:DHA2 family metal-tetracycline-proton antiporter-like MFS transporter
MFSYPAPDLKDKTVQRLILTTVSLASFLGMLDISIVNIATPVIIKDWQISIGYGSLILIAYLLTDAVLIMIMGSLADRYGFKKMLVNGMIIFCAGTIICGFAPDIDVLIGARILQAIGAAMFSVVGPAVITTCLPSSVRGRSLGYLITFSAIGFALGPGIGGLLTAYAGWRWIFFVSVPVALLTIFLALRYLPPDTPLAEREPLDLIATAAFMVFIGGTLSAFAFYQVPGTPDKVLLLLLCTGIVAGTGFFIRNRRSKNPLIRPGLLANRHFMLGIVACFIVTALFSGVTYLMPLYLVNSRHLDTFLAGLIMTVPALLSMVVAPAAGSLSDEYGSPIVSAIAIGMSAIGFIFFFTFNPTTAIAIIVAGVIITRVSTAAFFGPNGRLIMGHCYPDAVGNGAGVMMTVRKAGLTLGIALFQSVFAIRMYAEGIPRDGTPLVPRLTPALSVLGYQAVYGVAFILCIIVIAILLVTRDAGYWKDGPEPESEAGLMG